MLETTSNTQHVSGNSWTSRRSPRLRLDCPVPKCSLFKELGGLLTQSAVITASTEAIPLWSPTRHVHGCLKEDTLQDLDIPMIAITALVGFSSSQSPRLFRQHLVRRGAFWTKGAPGVSNAYLQYKRLIDDAAYQELEALESVESGLVLQPARRAQINAATGHSSAAAAGHPHKIRNDQSWMTQGATSKGSITCCASYFYSPVLYLRLWAHIAV